MYDAFMAANWLTVGSLFASALFGGLAAHDYFRVCYGVWEYVPVVLRNNRVRIGIFVFDSFVPAKIRSTYIRCWRALSASLICIGGAFLGEYKLSGAMAFSAVGVAVFIRSLWLAQRNRNLSRAR